MFCRFRLLRTQYTQPAEDASYFQPSGKRSRFYPQVVSSTDKSLRAIIVSWKVAPNRTSDDGVAISHPFELRRPQLSAIRRDDKRSRGHTERSPALGRSLQTYPAISTVPAAVSFDYDEGRTLSTLPEARTRNMAIREFVNEQLVRFGSGRRALT